MNQDLLFKIVEIVALIVAGGGLQWLFNYSTKKRAESNKVAADEFENMAEIVDKFNERMAMMALELNEIIATRNSTLMKLEQMTKDLKRSQERVIELQKENNALREELAQILN